MAGAANFVGLVKSSCLVVESLDAGQRRKYRGVVLAVPQASARGRSADLFVRHVAVERRRWPVGNDRSRNLLRRAVGDDPAPVRHNDRGGHRLERGVGDLAVDPHRRMLLMACSADH
jgi:hypothetical protein